MGIGWSIRRDIVQKMDKSILSSQNAGHRIMDSGRQIPGDVRKKFLTIRTAGQWNQLPRKLVNTSLLDLFRQRLEDIGQKYFDVNFIGSYFSCFASLGRWTAMFPACISHSISLQIWVPESAIGEDKMKKSKLDFCCIGKDLQTEWVVVRGFWLMILHRFFETYDLTRTVIAKSSIQGSKKIPSQFSICFFPSCQAGVS